MPKGPKGVKRPADVNARAVMIARIATGELEDNPSSTPKRAIGGRVGGKARAKKLTPDQRATIAKRAAKVRWKIKK
ncbi:MAG: RNA-binding protein [Alphaproteobacteria bacterium]|nr:RNA-binding protein [Alphaproteobacteria bacterium]